MAATPHYTSELQYELCYFDDGKLTTITIYGWLGILAKENISTMFIRSDLTNERLNKK